MCAHLFVALHPVNLFFKVVVKSGPIDSLYFTIFSASRDHPLQFLICPSSPAHFLPFRPLLLPLSVTWLLPSHSSHSFLLLIPSLSPLPLSPGHSPPILPTLSVSSPLISSTAHFVHSSHSLCHLVTPSLSFHSIS